MEISQETWLLFLLNLIILDKNCITVILEKIQNKVQLMQVKMKLKKNVNQPLTKTLSPNNR